MRLFRNTLSRRRIVRLAPIDGPQTAQRGVHGTPRIIATARTDPLGAGLSRRLAERHLKLVIDLVRCTT